MIIQLSHEVLEFTARAGNGMSPKIPSIYYLYKKIAKIKYNLRILYMYLQEILGKQVFTN